jgi:deoxycytidine triphosphate deaminase
LVLSDRDIRLHLASGKIRITPPIDFDTQLGSCSVDFRLGTKFRVFEHSRFAYIARRVPASLALSVVDQARVAGFKGLDTRDDPVRSYPDRDVAAI